MKRCFEDTLFVFWTLTCIIIISQGVNNVLAMDCYSCTGRGTGTLCANITHTMPGMILHCPRTSCTIVRVENITTGKVDSFYRGCDNRYFKPECVKDSRYVTCSYSCSTNLCNNGTGITLANLKDFQESYARARAGGRRNYHNKNAASSFHLNFPILLVLNFVVYRF